ncbi:MAG: SpoIID/LytB domain-containing protein [Clostridiales Family XIII bacterium]|jgi:SpoIID/LytB domain protein|nr:SpoIID/LytB domain-containing protein [Clostridiales Family XIII bacterium]
MQKITRKSGKAIRLSVVFALTAALFLSTAQAAFAEETLVLPASVPVIADNVVRVHLSSYGNVASASMEAIGSYKIQDNGKALSGVFVVAATEKGIRLSTTKETMELDGDVYIKAANLTPNNRIKINGAYQYAGDLRILNKSGKIKLINHVNIETYVAGILPYEVNDAWPIEALKAQAVAARTYAYFTMNSRTRSKVEQDIGNSTNEQVYFGYNSGYANCLRAVADTKNMILKTPSGENVYACFSASNGGATETGTASGTAARDYAYLPQKDDPYDLAYALATTVYSGKLTIPKKIPADKLQTSKAQPYKMLREKLTADGIDVDAISGNVTVKKITLTGPKYKSPDRGFTGATIKLAIPKASTVTLKFDAYKPSGSSVSFPFLNKVMGYGTKFSMLYLRNDDTSWLLASVRYGHGAGLSQTGAYQLASKGKNFKQILKFYYNLGSATELVTMPWTDNTSESDPGYKVKKVSKTGSANVGSSTLNVRSGPSTGYSIVSSLKNGTKVKITGQAADWWRIDLGSGKIGFVSGAFIKVDAKKTPAPETPAPAPEAKTGTVNTPGTTLNVRSGAGTNYEILGSLKHGASITITGESGSWYTLSYNSKTGYVSKSFVTVKAAATPPPASETTPKKGKVTNAPQGLNVRSGAGTNYRIVGGLTNGTTVNIKGQTGDWYKIKYDGKAAYVNKAFIK